MKPGDKYIIGMVLATLAFMVWNVNRTELPPAPTTTTTTVVQP